MDINSLIKGLAGGKKILRFYDVVYSYLQCSYSRFLEAVIPEDERAPLPESVLERMASGRRFEAAHVGRLIAAQLDAGVPPVLAAGEYWVLDPDSDPAAEVKGHIDSSPAYRSFGLVADGTYHPLDADGRRRKGAIRKILEAAPSQLILVGVDEYHDLADPAARSAARDELTLRTVSALADGLTAMREGRNAPVIIGPNLPRTYVAELDMDLVGAPDLLVPVYAQQTYTSVDYKDSSVLSASTKAASYPASPSANPLLDVAEKTDLGNGILNKKHRLQLFHYYLMLQPLLKALGAPATPVAGIIGRQDLVAWSDQTEKVYGRSKQKESIEDMYFDIVQDSLDAYALGEMFASGVDVELPVELGPARKAECAECPFRRHCEEELRRNGGHLTLHPDISVTKALEIAEILPAPTLESLAFSDAADLTRKAQIQGIKGFGQSVEDQHERLQVLVDGARAIHRGKSYRRRDQARIPTLEAVVEVHFDLENNNNPMAGGRIPANYWFQTGWVTKKGVDDLASSVYTRYHCRFADGSPVSEAEMFASFWASMQRLHSESSSLYDELVDRHGADAMNRIRARGGTEALDHAANRLNASSRAALQRALGVEAMAGIVPFRAFVYSPAEFRIMRAKAKEHLGFPGVPDPDELTAWFVPSKEGRPESAVAVDLCKFLEVYTHLPLPDRKLKTVAPYVGHYWEVDDPNGLSATFKADVMLSNPDSDEAEEARVWLRKYNKADCVANLEIRRWIDATPWKGVEQLDAEGVFRARFPRRATRRNTDITLFDAIAS